MAKMMLKDFTGGISDKLQNVDPSFCDECNNLTITPNQGLAIRDGSTLYNNSYPTPTTGVSIGSTFILQDVRYVQGDAKLYRSDSTTSVKVGDALGTEMFINPNFTGSATGWDLGGGWSYGSNRIHHTAGTAGAVSQTAAMSVTIGKTYLMSFTYEGNSDPCALQITWDGTYVKPSIQDNNTLYLYSAVGPTARYSVLFYAIATGNPSITFSAASAVDCYLDTTSFKEVTESAVDDIFTTGASIDYSVQQNQAIITSDKGRRPVKLYKDYNGVTYCNVAGLPDAPPYFGLLSSGGTGGGLNFTYYWCYRFDYYVGDVLYSDFSPVVYHEVTNRNYYPSSSYPYTVQIGTSPLLADNWPKNKVHIELYRTYLGVPYLVGTYGPNIVEMVDVFTNAEISARPVLYTYGGVKDNDAPPIASYICSDGQTTYYADIYTPSSAGRHLNYTRAQYLKTQINQAVSLDPDSCPESFYANVEDDIMGIESVNGKVCVFTKTRIYRVEGTFDELGAGGMTPVEIHDHAGCVGHNSLVKSKDAIYWVGVDGFYVTNGYEVKRLPLKKEDLLEDTHKAMTIPVTKYPNITGTFDSSKNLVYWGCSLDPVVTTNSTLMVYSVNEDAFTTQSGDTTSNSKFYPTALDCNYTGLVRATGEGFLFQHSSSEKADKVYNTALAAWYYSPIRIQYKSLKLDFGSPNENKYVTKITANMKNISNVNLQVTSYNDGRDDGNLLQEIRCVDYGTASFHGVTITDSSYVYGQDFIKSARFPTNKLRCKHKVVDIQNFNGTIFWYDQGGYGKVSITSSTKKATLASGSWPTNVEQMSLYIEGDTNPYVINTRNSATELTLATAPAGDPATKKWEIKGIEKGQDIEFNSIEFDFMPYGMAGTGFSQVKDEVGNA